MLTRATHLCSLTQRKAHSIMAHGISCEPWPKPAATPARKDRALDGRGVSSGHPGRSLPGWTLHFQVCGEGPPASYADASAEDGERLGGGQSASPLGSPMQSIAMAGRRRRRAWASAGAIATEQWACSETQLCTHVLVGTRACMWRLDQPQDHRMQVAPSWRLRQHRKLLQRSASSST